MPGAVVALSLIVSSCGAGNEPREVADLVLTGGTVVTVNDAQPVAEALAIADGRILAVGSGAEIESLAGPETRVVDLAGRIAIPGFIEGHGHFLSLGNAKTILELGKANSWEEIVQMVADEVQRLEPGVAIRGRGWHQEKWDHPPDPAVEGSPVHHSLSAVSPVNPVLLTHASGHAAFANARALELAGLNAESPDPPGGQLVRDAAGQLTGMLRETAQRLVASAFSYDVPGVQGVEEWEATMRHLVELAGAEALAKGVTSFHDAGVPFDVIDLFRQLEEERALPVRLYVMVRRASLEELDRRLPDYRMVAEGNDFLTVRSIKKQIDGALGSHGAWLLAPYSDMPSSVGLVLEPEEEVRGTAEIAIRHGFQVNTHAIGDRANRRVLDIYEEVFEKNGGPADLRWRIEHAQHVDPADVGRFAQLGVIASMQSVHCTSDGPWVPKRIGDDRAEATGYLWRALLDSGAVVTNGTDVPVEDIDPLANFHAAVTRRMRTGGQFYPAQAMTREEALRSYTLANAYAAFEEDLKGSLEPGKLADVVVLSRDILTIPADEILETNVDYTIVGGEVRYERRP